ncbi:MAG TPA: hypothetical protein VMF89_10765, partial [Polyangiales bacterium]|nr:hypothetical protein [Polyangiales bacterium]
FTGLECGLLLDVTDRQALGGYIIELISAGVVRFANEQCRLEREHWVPVLRAQLSPAREAILSRRLAGVFLQHQKPVRAAHQLFRAGDNDAGLDVLVEHSRLSQEATATNQEEFVRYVRQLPNHCFETYERALALADSLDRPPRDKYLLLGRLAGIMPAFGIPGRAHFSALIQLLEDACGYSDYRRLDHALSPELRAERALALAKARYEAATDRERVLDPITALRMMLRTLISAASAVALGADVPFLRSFPQMEPFAKLAPGTTVITSLLAGMHARYSGRLELAREIYVELIERTASESGMLDPSHVNVMRLAVMNGLAVTEACMGMASSLHWSERTAIHPAYRMNSLQSRKLYELYMGDIERVEGTTRQLEHVRVQTLQLYETSNLLWEIGAHVICEDLTRLRRALEALEPLAQQYEAWRAVRHYVQAEHQRVRRAPQRALADSEAAMARAVPGEHPLWAAMASSHVRVLSALGRHTEALRACEGYVERARAAGLGFMAEELWIALALCQAALKQREAILTADAVVERLSELGVHGIWLGLAHETRARVSLALGDRSGFEAHLQSARDAYGSKHAALRAKLRRLSQEAERGAVQPATLAGTLTSQTGMQLMASLDQCSDMVARGQVTLDVLCRQTGATSALMYLLLDDRLDMVAASGGESDSPLLARAVRQFLDSQAAAPVHTQTGEEARPVEASWPSELAEYRPLLLSHAHARGLVLTGVVVLTGAGAAAYPARLLSALSLFWAGTGEVSTLLAAEDEASNR